MDKQNLLHNIYSCKDNYDTSKFQINLIKENILYFKESKQDNKLNYMYECLNDERQKKYKLKEALIDYFAEYDTTSSYLLIDYLNNDYNNEELDFKYYIYNTKLHENEFSFNTYLKENENNLDEKKISNYILKIKALTKKISEIESDVNTFDKEFEEFIENNLIKRK